MKRCWLKAFSHVASCTVPPWREQPSAGRSGSWCWAWRWSYMAAPDTCAGWWARRWTDCGCLLQRPWGWPRRRRASTRRAPTGDPSLGPHTRKQRRHPGDGCFGWEVALCYRKGHPPGQEKINFKKCLKTARESLLKSQRNGPRRQRPSTVFLVEAGCAHRHHLKVHHLTEAELPVQQRSLKRKCQQQPEMETSQRSACRKITAKIEYL